MHSTHMPCVPNAHPWLPNTHTVTIPTARTMLRAYPTRVPCVPNRRTRIFYAYPTCVPDMRTRTFCAYPSYILVFLPYSTLYVLNSQRSMFSLLLKLDNIYIYYYIKIKNNNFIIIIIYIIILEIIFRNNFKFKKIKDKFYIYLYLKQYNKFLLLKITKNYLNYYLCFVWSICTTNS